MLLLIMMIIDDDNGDGDDGDNHDADHLSLVGLPRHHDRVPSRLRPHKSRRVELLDVRLRYHHLYHLSCKISSTPSPRSPLSSSSSCTTLLNLELCKTLTPSFHPLHMDGGLALEVLQHPAARHHPLGQELEHFV